MLKKITFIACAAAMSLAALPAAAQEAEEPRTTYAVTMLKFADGADEERWLEVMTNYVNPAREASGAAPQSIHWVMMNPDYDIITVADMNATNASDTSCENELPDWVRAWSTFEHLRA